MDKKLKILLVNDDGISSPGIVHLAEMAMQLGEVWVAAPSSQCSAMSQKLTIFQPLDVEEYDFPLPVAGAYSIGGTPASTSATTRALTLPIPAPSPPRLRPYSTASPPSPSRHSTTAATT